MIKKMRLVALILTVVFMAFIVAGCGGNQEADTPEPDQTPELEGKLVVYHAGSLAIPFEAVEKEFETLHPGVDIERTAGGSRDLARKVVDLGDKVDILASADYIVIDDMMIPEHAEWNAAFAKNSMVIMYTDKSKYADEITKDNWYEVLLKEGVKYGHSEPNSDPCGYRTVLSWQLAEKKYETEGLFKKLTDGCPKENIRPKSVELITMLETGALDYAFEYESVARQHAAKNPAFKWVELPGKVNLGEVKNAEFYKQASIDLQGKEPGQINTVVGEPIVYGITMPTTGENPELAIEFLKYLFNREQGLKILEDNGQPVIDEITLSGENFPEALKDVMK